MTNRQFVLLHRPIGLPKAQDFALTAAPIPEPPAGGFVMRNHFASLDPAQRGWMDEAPSYMPPISLGSPIRASTVGRVHSSANEDFSPGDWVAGLNALEDYSVVTPGGYTRKVDVAAVPSPTYFLSALGISGMTAYFALLEQGRPLAGETVLVSAAAGAVGSLVGQIARIKGCRTIGIAGGAEKCRRLLEDYHYDAAIDHRGKDRAQLSAAIAQAAPERLNLVFENVGGDILDAGLKQLARGGRVVLCGLISEYNNTQGTTGAHDLWQLIVQRAHIHGFLVSDYATRFPAGLAQMSQWIAAGQIRVDEHIEHGLENAYETLMKLFSGGNRGKLILRIV